MIIVMIGVLTLYMGYLVFLEPLTIKWRQNSYRQQKEEEVRRSTTNYLLHSCKYHSFQLTTKLFFFVFLPTRSLLSVSVW